ncbi:MAG: thioesterase [Actinobacteria bacterium]|nr:thioesterase [Actinomycetota bacterium]
METFRGIVRPNEIDQMGHMNVAYYVDKFDHGSWGFFGEIGMDAAWMVEHHRGMMAVDQHIKYRAELVAGDRVIVTTDVLGLTEKTIRILHTMTNVGTGNVAATAEMVAVFVDLDNRSGLPLPPDVRAVVERLRDTK